MPLFRAGLTTRLRVAASTAFAEPGPTEVLTGEPLAFEPAEPEPPVFPGPAQDVRTRFPVNVAVGDGLIFTTPDDDFELRVRLMQQTDAKLFVPTGQDPARSGLYIPRFRTYFEGRFTRSFEYELSIQRSIEGTFDVLDANVTYTPSEQVQVRFGRSVVPYSFEWFDHIEQYFITPERGLFPLNFGLSRQAGVTVAGRVLDGVVQYAVGGYSGQLSGLADDNNTRDGVAYVNVRPFLHFAGLPRLRNFYVGGSVALGEQAFPSDPLPLRTAVQSSENDEAAAGASAVFLDYLPGVVASGVRRQGAGHIAWYESGLSVEAEGHVGRFGLARADGFGAEVPVAGWSVAAAYLATGEVIDRRTAIVPLRPFDPVNNLWGPVRHRAVRPGQPAAGRGHRVRRGIGRPRRLEQPGHGPRHRRQLVPDPVPEAHPRLAAQRVRLAGPHQRGDRAKEQHERPVLVPSAGELLIRFRL